MAPDGRPLAEFTDRLLARLIDGAIMFGVILVLMIPIIIAIFSIISNAAANAQFNPDGSVQQPDAAAIVLPILGLYALIFVISFALTYVYEVELQKRGGQTYGKRAMKIAVISLEPGTPLGRGVFAKRWLVHSLGGTIIPMFSWVDGLWQLWDQPYRQCLHDKFAKTLVVKVAQ